jgi:hypothetical protein
MPKLVTEQEYLERRDVKAVIRAFEGKQMQQYCEIRKGLVYKKRRPYDERPIRHEVELTRILKRLVTFDILIKFKVRRDSFYILNPLKYQETFSPAKVRFEDSKKDKSGIEKEFVELREQNMALILENTNLKERLAQYEGSWAAAP